jgi:hypothetical protein
LHGFVPPFLTSLIYLPYQVGPRLPYPLDICDSREQDALGPEARAFPPQHTIVPLRIRPWSCIASVSAPPPGRLVGRSGTSKRLIPATDFISPVCTLSVEELMCKPSSHLSLPVTDSCSQRILHRLLCIFHVGDSAVQAVLW